MFKSSDEQDDSVSKIVVRLSHSLEICRPLYDLQFPMLTFDVTGAYES